MLKKILMATAMTGVLVSTSGCGWIYPPYREYSARWTGKAELARALSSKKVAVETSKAKLESATYESQAEVIRAQGVAKANAVIGDSLKNNEAYLRYLYVNNLSETKNQVIYVPTEAGLPILEAGKRPARE